MRGASQVDELELEAHLDERFGASEEPPPRVEEPAGPPEEGATPEERQRDAQGRFVAQEQEQQQEQEGEEPESDPDVRALLDKYGGNVDLALKAAAEAQSHIGRQAQELGELRKAVEGLHQEFTTEEYPVDDGLVNWAQQAAIENPVEAAIWSLKNQPAVYDTIMAQWYTDDPMGASRFERSLEMQAYRTQVQQELAPVIQPAQEVAQRESFMRAWGSVQSEYPELPEYSDQILNVARGNQDLLQALANPDPETKTRVLRTLFLVARGMNMGALTEGAQQQSQETADALRRQAAVGTMTSSAPPAASGGGVTGRLNDWRRDFREEAGLPTDDL